MYSKSYEELLIELASSSETGLDKSEVEERLKKYGLNELPEPKKQPLIFKFFDQFKNILIVLLILATAVSFFLGETVDAIAILTIVIINAAIGFAQEYKAEKAIEALKKMSASFTKVLRNGEISKLESKYLVPGDIIIIEAGDKIPADARLIEAANLEVSEAVLTGESVPVHKSIEKIERQNLSLGDQKNILFKDTTATYGRGRAVVYATGINTEVGKISTLLKSEETPQTPLQLELKRVGKNLSFAALLIIVFIFAAEILTGRDSIREAFQRSVSLAVAAIPEGLPAVMTMVLAIGVTKLAKKKAVIRKLPAVETLGATTHILTDKTGTLTQNRMVVTNIFLPGDEEFMIDGEGYEPKGNFTNRLGNKINPKDYHKLMQTLRIGVLCNDSVLNFNEEKRAWEIVGDITEGALVVCAQKAGLDHVSERKNLERTFEIPFSSESKFMVTAHNDNEQVLICMKGAPEIVVNYCDLDDVGKAEIAGKIDAFAGEGLRSLGFAYKLIQKGEFDSLTSSKQEVYKNLKFAGIVAQRDPLRSEVRGAVREAVEAGITTIMVTGDHKLTAFSIGKELGIASSETEVKTGEELSSLSDEEFDSLVGKIKIFARVSPEQKLKLVKAFRKQKFIVAVTGDGVNDAPAIKAANIGVSMGIEGTDVAKEASDMVLQNDNYATIVAAVREGRVIFDNMVKFITYLISCNISEILIFVFAIIAGLPDPLTAIHILWINLVTDGFPALALGMEPGELDVMKRNPRDVKRGILTSQRWKVLTVEGLLMGLASFSAFYFSYNEYGIEEARTVAFLTLAAAQLVHSLNSRSERHSLFKIGILQNRFLFSVFTVSVLIHLPIIYTRFGEVLFEAVPLSLPQILPVAIAATSMLPIVEVIKIFKRRRYISLQKETQGK